MSSRAASPFVDAQLAAAGRARLPGAGLDWLDAARHENLAAFAAAGLPDGRVEAWKYTALRAFAQRRYGLADAASAGAAIDPAVLELAGLGGPRLVFVNGQFRADLSALEQLPRGLSLRPLSQVLGDAAEPLRPSLSRRYPEVGEVFARLNGALASDGVVLEVSAGAKIEAPVQALFIGAPAQSALAWHVRNRIALGAGAELTLVERHIGADDHAHLGNLLSELVIERDARLTQVVLQTAASSSHLVRRTQVQVQGGGHANLYMLELGAAWVRHDLDAELIGDGARLETRGVFALRGRQHADTQLAIRHLARNTVSDALWRGVADERSRGIFRGAIVVAEGADGADAALSNKNLLLSGDAEIDTKPELEIYADEVKAAHGATVGQLDERSMFYLRSRGIPQAEARALLTVAFCREVIDDLPYQQLRESLSDALLAHLP